jgi:membrane protein DedA with SNARE-associated domain
LDFSWLFNFFLEYGYVGITAISIVGNMIPFLPVPYLVAIFLLAPYLNPLVVAIGVAVGATLGKCISYLIGRGGYSLLGASRKEELLSLSSMLDKYGAIAVFFFAALPLPDDIIIIPFGLMKYNFTKFFVALFLGKLTLGFIVAYAAFYGWGIISWLVGENNILLITGLSIVFMVLMIYLIFKINWIEAAEYVSENGVLAYIKLLLKRTFRLGKP